MLANAADRPRRSARGKLPYAEGDWFAVPLPTGGFGLGRLARIERGFLLGYFFGPKLAKMPSLDGVAPSGTADAVYIKLFGGLGFLWLDEGRWRVLGHRGWDRQDWPLPLFRKFQEHERQWITVDYSRTGIADIGSRTRSRPAEVIGLPDDGLAGSEYVEGTLDGLLAADVRSPALGRPFVEGSWLSIPIDDQCSALGRVARS